MKLEEKLVQLRKEKGLSQMYVAEALEVSRQAISRWEVGSALPSTENLRKLAELYGVSVDSLLKDSVDIQTAQKEEQTADELLRLQENTSAPMSGKPAVKTVRYAVISAILALMVFLAGYMIGRAKAEKTQNEPIPLSELETIEFDFSDAVSNTFGWPDFGEEGE